LYGYTTDLDDHGEVAAASAQYRFVQPRKVELEALSRTPLLLVRAGRDEVPGLNTSLDRFVPRAVAANVPLTLVSYPEGPHAFDILDASTGSRSAIRQVLAFLRTHLVETTSA
jgi:acetyl esterase/lipase